MAYIPPHRDTPGDDPNQLDPGGVVDPKTILSEFPCITCLNDTELRLVIVWALAYAVGYTLPDQTTKLFNDSVCFDCLTEKQMIQVVALVLGSTLLGESNELPTTVQNALKCLRCANPGQIKAAMTFLLVQLLQTRIT